MRSKYWFRFFTNALNQQRISRRNSQVSVDFSRQLELLETRTMLSAVAGFPEGFGGSLATARGMAEVQGEDVVVEALVFVADGADAEEVGRAALASFGASPLESHEFTTTGIVWDQFSDSSNTNDFVTQYYNPSNDATGGAGEAALLASQATWNAISTSTFEISYGGTTSRLPSLVKETPGRQKFDGYNDVAWMSLRDPNTLGVTWTGTSTDEADMAMNTNFSWYTDGVNNFDAQTVFLHENGHVGGVGHSEVDGTVMEAVYAGVRRTLQQDDIDAISSLYPAAPTGDLPPEITITSPSDGGTVIGSVTITTTTLDDIGVDQVEFFIGGNSLDVDLSDPFSAAWDTTAVADGLYTITATATDTIGQTTSTSVDVTVDNIPDPPPPPSEDPEMYVSNISWSEKIRRRSSDLMVTVDILADSDGSQSATSGDTDVESANVFLLLIQDTDGDGLYETNGDDSTWTGTAATGSNGEVTFKLRNASVGNYEARITDVTHSTNVWNSAYDTDNPDQYYGFPGGSDALVAGAQPSSPGILGQNLNGQGVAQVVVNHVPGNESDPVTVEVTVEPNEDTEINVNVDTSVRGKRDRAADVNVDEIDLVFGDLLGLWS